MNNINKSYDHTTMGDKAKFENVMLTKKLGICVSCEICAAACPQNAITMEFRDGQFLPMVDEKKCKKCGLCLKVCPGFEIDTSENIFKSGCLEAYIAHVKNAKNRKNSTSGGLVTTLVSELLKNRDYDSAFLLNFDLFKGTPARLEKVTTPERALETAKSKYIPASAYYVIKELKSKKNQKLIIVGTPCLIRGIKKFLKINKIPEKNILFFGLFCDRVLNFYIYRYFEEIYKKGEEKLEKLEFRNKELDGWPGHVKLYFNSGRTVFVDYTDRIWLKPYFQIKRCLFCFDNLNHLADISFGDGQVKGMDSPFGNSTIIIRTEKGKKVFDKYKYLFELKETSLKAIKESQGIEIKKQNHMFARLFCGEARDEKLAKVLAKHINLLELGKNYNVKKIRARLLIAKIITKTKKFLGLKKGENKKENIIIHGIYLSNKGSQAMCFSTINWLKQKFPEKKIYVFSSADFKRKDEEKYYYGFYIYPFEFRTKLRLIGGPLARMLLKSNQHPLLEQKVTEVIKNTAFFVDVSGYALGSQWGLRSSLNYLLNIIIAKKHSIPYYILPQSIGPFDYGLIGNLLLFPLMKMYLKYPAIIMPRERTGVKYLKKFTEKNVMFSYDLVLLSDKYDLNKIFNENISFKTVKINKNSVGIIPNRTAIRWGEPEKIYSIYEAIIDKLISAKKEVFILRHATEDLEICQKIKQKFRMNRRVKLIAEDLNALEIEAIIKQFDFVVASRYHSLIHAYKNGVPALVLGWADKYPEIMKDFGQSEYCFDVRKGLEKQQILAALDKLITSYKQEKRRIEKKLVEIKKNKEENCFKILEKLI